MELATSRFFGTTKGHKKERKFKDRTTIDTRTQGHQDTKNNKEKNTIGKYLWYFKNKNPTR
jgi:hypothetical protein